MIEGHGDDLYRYGGKLVNFSSNVYGGINHSGLVAYLANRMEVIRNYPEPEPKSLERVIECREQLDSGGVCVTNGATEAIYLIAQAMKGSCSAVLQPTFSEYADAARLHGHQVVSFYTLDVRTIPEKAQVVWICNPNNPTGMVYDKALLAACVQKHPHRLFVLDQSYEAFTQRPLFTAAEAAAYPNLLVLHSMTKHYALPGLRLGYVTGCVSLIDLLRRQRMPWSVNALAVEAGHYLLQHEDEFAIDLPALLAEKDRVAEALRQIGGMEVWPSDTHYLLVQLRSGTAASLKAYLAEECGMLIRDAANFEGLDAGFFRIAVQGKKENDDLIAAIKKWIYLY